MSSDGQSETELRKRVQAGANAWKQVEGVMSDRHSSKKLKGKVPGACVTPAMLYGLETLPVSEKHQHRLQVCENNWVRRIAEVKRMDRMRMGELREEVGIKKCLMGRLVKSRMKWAGHVERMKEDRLPWMAYVYQERGKRKRGRPRMRWRQVEGVMSDRHISKKLKGKVLGACVTPAMLYGLVTLPVSEKHQHRLQVCENNWVRRIAGVKRMDRRMDELKRRLA